MTANISPCGKYRYSLRREWGQGPSYRTVIFVMLNPSTADATADDRTISRCISFAKREGFSALEVVNLFAWRETNPKKMFQAMARGEDVNGPNNDASIFEIVNCSSHKVICAWGAFAPSYRIRQVHDIIKMVGEMYCLGKTKDGSPRHPLYVRGDQPLIPWGLG